ncbi:5650_t:CDS:1, partial [Acaulospora morrowiae]
MTNAQQQIPFASSKMSPSAPSHSPINHSNVIPSMIVYENSPTDA